MTDRSRFKKNTIYQYGLQAAKYLFPFVTLAYLTRVLGVETYAVRAYVMAAMSFMLVFLDFGFISYGTAAIARAESNLEAQRNETSAITILRFALCFIGAVALVPITLAIPLLAAHPLYVAIAYIGTCLKALLPDFVFQGREDMGILTTRFVVTQAIAVVLIFMFIHGSDDLLLVAVIEAAANLVALVWSWANVFNKQGISFMAVRAKELTRVLKESSVYFIASAATTLFSTITTLLIGIFIEDAAQISYWSLAMTAVVALQALYSPVANSLFPHMVKQADFALAKRILFIGTPLACFAAFLLALFHEPVMLVLGGQDYLPGAYVIALVAPVLAFSFPAVILGYPILAAVNWVKELTATSVMAGLFNVVGLLVLVPLGLFTIETVALIRCLTEVVLFLSRLFFVLKYRARVRKSENTM